MKLKEAIDRSVSFNFNHNDQGNKNTLNYSFYASAGLIDNSIADSISIDQQNRQTLYFINADGNKYLRLGINLSKSYKLKAGELTLGIYTSANFSKTPGYINGAFSFAENRNLNSTLLVNYNLKSVLGVEFRQSVSNYKSKQLSFSNATYSGTTLTNMLSTIYNVTKKFAVNTNISVNKNSTQNAKDVNFTLWNASATYRFLKGNNAEFKFSALDLLHQNTSVLNYGQGNGFTVGTQQVLQQYFMTTLSYYPRKFGKNAVKK